MSEKCFVKTVKDRCRVCYTCVRTCPAKAIRISAGQAEIIPERCIGCGNCVKVCSQGAKEVVDTTEKVMALIRGPRRVAAMVAPSFPAEIEELDFRVFVGMLRSLGFDRVNEVAFGADLVAERYRQLLVRQRRTEHIATSCPAVVAFVERYHPKLVDSLAPIVSPMVACARVLKEIEGPDLAVVFIGPCVAKKQEACDESLAGDVDEVITFSELSCLFEAEGITPAGIGPSDFDPPYAGLGAVFPIARGMLQAAGIEEDLVSGTVVSAEGRRNFVCALDEMAEGTLETNLLETLACSGCIVGPGMNTKTTLFLRRSRVSQYAAYRQQGFDTDSWHRGVDRFAGLDLSRTYNVMDQRSSECSEESVKAILKRMGKHTVTDELNCGACGYQTCRNHAIAIYKGFAESEMCLPYVIEEFQRTIGELSKSHRELAETQEMLLHSERLASMGQLAAGVAHELNNPLGVVLLYAHVLLDEVAEDSVLREDLKLIAEQADRCKSIVSNLLDFARESKALIQEVDLRNVVNRAVHTVPHMPNITVETVFRHTSSTVQLDSEQMMQVLTNLLANAFAVMPDGGRVSVETSESDEDIFIRVADTGSGIPPSNIKKIFQPFFTTKEIGKGTGLGLAVVYGIVKMHRGDINVESNADASEGPTGTVFTIRLPKKNEKEET